jgi:hypothetical protein
MLYCYVPGTAGNESSIVTMDTVCIKNVGIFRDEKAINFPIKEGYRITLISKEVKTLMNRVLNPMPKLCKYNNKHTIIYAVTKPIRLDDAAVIRQVDESVFAHLLADCDTTLFKISGPHKPMYAPCYTINY